MKTFCFKLYKAKRNRKLHRQINAAGLIYNHCIALHKRYYRLYHKSLNVYALQKHLTKLKKIPRFSYLKEIGAQAVQDITQRIDRAYKLFFRNLKQKVRTAPPSFKKVRKYKSYTLKQAGWKLLEGNAVRIGTQKYRYFKSRGIEGTVKTVTIKRDALGDLYLYFVCETAENEVLARTGKSVGYDFGLTQFLTASDGNDRSPALFQGECSSDTQGRESACTEKARVEPSKEGTARTGTATQEDSQSTQRLSFQAGTCDLRGIRSCVH